jgi:hypothetical protein
MSYTAHHRSHHGACSPEACGSGVWASRDPQAATSGQAATPTHTSDRHHEGYPSGLGRTRSNPPGIRPALAPRILLACPRSSPSPTDAATTGQPDDAQAWCPAPTPSTAAPSGGRATTRSAGTAPVARTSSTPARHGTRNSVPGPRRAGRQRHGGVFVAVPEPSPPEPGSHHKELTEQHFATHRCQ